MSRLSVVVPSYNSYRTVEYTVESLLKQPEHLVGEIIVVDSHSTDGTIEIAEGLGARVVKVAFSGFGNLRNTAIAACGHEWILSIDSDERCTPEAAAEVRQIMLDPTSLDVYQIPRRNFFMGRWIKHSGWYPNYRQPQLFRKGSMSYELKAVHEGYVLDSAKPIGHLKNAIWQFPFKNMSEVMHKANRYSSLGAQRISERRISMGTALSHGLWSFVKHYIFKLGFLDGWAGFVIALGNFEGTFYRYVKALEVQKGDAWRAPATPAANVGNKS